MGMTLASPMTISDQLRAAEAAAVAPRQAVAKLQASLDAAVAAGDFAAANTLQSQLRTAAEEDAIATAAVDALRGAAVRVEQQAAAARRKIEEARRRETAQAEIGQAIEADRQAVEDLDAALAQFWGHVAAAQARFREALECEQRAGVARQRVVDVRVAIGELEAPGPRAAAPNKASVLIDEVPLVRAVVHWQR
jgi:chromosome segregation ATPase